MATITSPRPQSPASSNRISNANPVQASHSPTVTPSSSARHSLDLQSAPNGRTGSPGPVLVPSVGQAGNLASQAPAIRRNRAALRDYYNLKSRPQQPLSQSDRGSISRKSSTTSTATTVTNDLTSTSTSLPPSTGTSILPPSIDDPSFDPQSYVQNLQRTFPLHTLLKTEAALISEIKYLDGERKALVYDNYSKLIGATKMIGQMQRAMNDGVGATDFLSSGKAHGGLKEVESVKEMVEKIGKVAAELSSENHSSTTYDGHHGQTEGGLARNQTHKINLVRWVVEAPSRFAKLSEEGKSEELLTQWKELSRVLDMWDGVKGIQEVRMRCSEIVERSQTQTDSTDVR